MSITHNIGKILANVGIIISCMVNRIVLNLEDKVERYSAFHLDTPRVEDLDEEDEDTKMSDNTNKSNYIPYNGPYCETP